LASTGRYRVLGHAESVKDALLLLDTCQPDVVVSDLSLPDGNAMSCCSVI